MHKVIGYIYIVSSIVGAVAGIYMAMFSYGGLLASVGFGILGCL
jgi:hypothetical protein